MIARVALVLAVCSTPALAQTAAAPVPAPAKPEKKVCRMYEETGSIMGGKRICHTKAEWASIDQANSDSVASSRDVNGHAGQMSGRVN